MKEKPEGLQKNNSLRALPAVYYVALEDDLTRIYKSNSSQRSVAADWKGRGLYSPPASQHVPTGIPDRLP